MNRHRVAAALVAMGCVTLAIAALTSRAELPPHVYEEMQAAAPEVVSIHVTRANDDGKGHIEVAATVTRVARTATNVKVGDAIALRYERPVYVPGEPPMVGPSAVPLLAVGETRPAYLRRVDGDNFEPAAGGMTFTPLNRDEGAPATTKATTRSN